MKTNDGTINVKLTHMGYRCGCQACGQVIEKFETHGVFGKDALVDTLCCRCLGQDFRPLLHAHGDAFVAEGQAFHELAARPLEDWSLPTQADIAAYQAELDAYWKQYAEEEEGRRQREAQAHA